jgi:hypothetical protein
MIMIAEETDGLDDLLDELEFDLAQDQSEAPAQWARRYRDDLRELTQTIRQHVATTESPGGALTTLGSSKQQTLATLDHAVHNLRLDHVELLNSASELYWKAQGLADQYLAGSSGVAAEGEMADARRAGEKLLRRVHQHQETERKLLMDTINTDVGVGD